jgi:UDP-N-acetylmuramoylalanine--D-glutamate ligase
VPLTEAALNSTPDQMLVAEISSFQLEWVKQFRPVAAGITNISEDHQERYDSFEQYAKTKLRVFAAQTPDEFAVLANSEVKKWGGELLSNAQFLKIDARKEEGVLTILDRPVPLDELPFDEPHNLSNAQLAGLLAYGALVATGRIAKGQLPGCVIEGLKQFQGLAHRMEPAGEGKGIKFINNSMCTNVEAVKASLGGISGGVRVLIGGKDKDLNFEPLRTLLSDGVHHAYIFGEAKQKIAEQIGAKVVYETLESAFRAALNDAQSGETVMLAPGCASTDQFRDFRDRGNVFKQLAKEWLES